MFNIYKQRLDGGTQQLVADIPGIEMSPVWSPDGSEIAFHSETGGPQGLDIRVVSADGGTAEQLTDFLDQDANPDWSPDGLAIAFQSQERVPFSTWMVSRDSVGMPWSDPVQLTDFGCRPPEWAPDGESLVCYTGARGGQFVRVSRDGEVLARLPKPAGIVDVENPEFSPDGSRIYFYGTHEDGSDAIWSISANGGEATRVVAFDHPSLTGLGFTVASENVYFVLTESESDIWVMDLEW